MLGFEDEALVLTALPHGENGAVVRFLAMQGGLRAGYVPGARGKARRALLHPGNRVALSLRAQMIGIMRRRCLPCLHEVGRMGGRREHGRCGTEEKAFHAEISWLSARCCGRSKTSS